MSIKYRPDFTTARWLSAPNTAPEGRVEVAFVEGMVGMRDSANPNGPILVFTPEEWEAFMIGAENGEFEV